MQIDQNVNDILLAPLLRRNLSITVDDFNLLTSTGPVPLSAQVVCETGDCEFRLELRDGQGRDLSSFFTTKKTFGSSDLQSGSGTVGGKVRVQVSGIRPPHSSTTSPIAAVRDSSASTHFERIEIPVTGFGQFSAKQLASLLEQVDQGKTDLIVEPDDDTPLEETEFEHLAVFSNCKLAFQNSSVVRTEEHGFWGKSSSSEMVSWDGEVFGGEFSLMREGDHLKVGFRHRAFSREESMQCAKALFAAVGYTHGINPWPSYLKVAEGGRVVDEHLRCIVQMQGRYTPLRSRHGHETPDAPTRLIASVAHWLKGLAEDERDDTDHSLWVFRGADNPNVPIPAKLAMIGGVIESLFTAADSATCPESFTTLQGEAIAWANEIEKTAGDSERASLARRLAGYLKSWPFRDRRVAWKETFLPLFPGRENWLNEIFNLYRDHRNPPAHGDFAETMATDGVELIHAIGRLSGFVNLVIAAKAGYKGPILESPSADRVFYL